MGRECAATVRPHLHQLHSCLPHGSPGEVVIALTEPKRKKGLVGDRQAGPVEGGPSAKRTACTKAWR